ATAQDRAPAGTPGVPGGDVCAVLRGHVPGLLLAVLCLLLRRVVCAWRAWEDGGHGVCAAHGHECGGLCVSAGTWFVGGSLHRPVELDATVCFCYGHAHLRLGC